MNINNELKDLEHILSLLESKKELYQKEAPEHLNEKSRAFYDAYIHFCCAISDVEKAKDHIHHVKMIDIVNTREGGEQ